MKNLWLFLVRYNAIFWFILFFVLSVILVVNNNNFQRASFINSSNILVGSFYKQVNSWKSYLSLSDANEKLAAENVLLRQQIQNLLQADTTADSVYLADSIEQGRYAFIVANVANNSVHQKSNYLTLDKGSEAGIEKGMGVITSNGVVGIVLQTSRHFSSVQSLLHPDTKISVTLDSSGIFGSLVWGSNIDPRFAMVRDIPNHVQVKQGQKVFTSGYSLFPEGIEVGEVIETGIKSGESFLDVKIRLSTNFSNLSHVYVVRDLLVKEKETLEETSQDNG
ncbi:rod shape-determining protein MreC [Sphingobacterium allocomposti]|jgi:rod shape-determining protein MreC|uniref:Cell shape-determining protein MreC n=1 Tax=Sphingobacterium allocomposti TaxID=415956 RepID=A0A5S5DMP1_9SPHI|nr:rod shape-determining protein MreC [Sphingobacterium composti Yoo et al. 2007 non Ten et al. 2007]TYP97187.1 rod shape-determining protein MreC [Sphingobacterium composti Yoo et al. 2007 non Ten et al. 2007]HLS96108.1 rod shape-determining protein MreC [Sphingobacterium sp.]